MNSLFGVNFGIKGFTLIEIMIVTLILGIIIGGIFGVLYVADKSWSFDMALLELQQAVRQAMDGMTREVRQSRPASITILNNTLSFYVPNISKVIRYALSTNNSIIRRHPQQVVKVLANNITGLNFCCIGGTDCIDCANSRILQIHIQAGRTVRGRLISFSLTEQVRLRNE